MSMTCGTPREVLVVSAERALRAGTELMIRSWGHRVIGRASDVETGLDLMRRRRPTVTVVDLHLANESGAELVRRAVEADPTNRIVVSVGSSRRLELERAIGCGARAVVLQSDDPQELLDAIDAVADGGEWVSRSVTHALAAADPWLLTRREREVFQLLSDGLNGRQASRVLVLAPETVRTHVRNAVRKLGAKTRVHAVTMALRRHEIGA
jgi:DNA-binding NarL/FixJ family response regulator